MKDPEQVKWSGILIYIILQI